MIHLDRELHKLAIALHCERNETAVALVCGGAARYSVYLINTRSMIPVAILGSGATGTEAMGSARAHLPARPA